MKPIGQLLMILFSLLYGIISWSFAYYGEMITYLGMTAPMAAIALVAWLRNPYKGRRSEVAVGMMSRREWCFMFVLTVAVTSAFYPILAALGTANLLPSTLSIATSFAAAYLTFFRVPYFALAYALNDIVLIALWVFASFRSVQYISVVVCFIVFLVNDMYGFINWSKMKKLQKKHGE
jgi:nicotinamide mononucleotide transporter PnuC